MRLFGKPAYILFVFMLSLGLLSACSGMFQSDDSGLPFYYAEFDDVAIPSELSSVTETTIITTPGGVKTGLQSFKGGAEVSSLNNAMIGYMQRDGWELRSSTRGTRSYLLFEKEDRYCSIYILDGMFNTEMLVYVSPKLGGSNYVKEAAPSHEPEEQFYNEAEEPTSEFDSQSLSE